MTPTNNTGTVSTKALPTGRILSGIAVVFMLFDGITKLMKR